MNRQTRIRNKRKTYHRIEGCLLVVLLVLLLLLLFLFRHPVSHSETEETVDEEPTATDLTVETPQEAEEEIDTFNKDVQLAENTATEAHHKTNGLAICMYHNVYDKDNPPDKLDANYIEVHALEEELQYLKDNDYYYPTWAEVRQYVDGELLLPEKSVVLTFDDGNKGFLKLAGPLFEQYEIPATSFLIGVNDGEEKVATYASDYLTFQSHSYNMHRGGGNIGHGGIFPALSVEEGLADLQTSIEICQNGDAFAYPYGDYTDSCREAVEKAGFLCAVTTENRRVNPGDDPLLLPRVRMSLNQSLNSFISLVE